MTDKNLLDSIIKSYENCFKKDDNEDTVEERVVISFLEYLGYRKEWGTPQKRIDMKNTCDRFICSPEGNKLIVEIKRAKHELNDEDKKQILRYLNGDAVEWGILTNGNDYLLINHKLNDLKPIDRYCLKYTLKRGKFHDTCKSMNDLFLNYFTYDYIFNRKATRFFSEFHRYKVNNLSNSSITSIRQYESTNFNFFNYITKDINDIVSLNDLTPRNLIKHFKNELENKKLSKDYIINKFRYVKSFVDFLEKEDILLNRNEFTKFTDKKIIKELNLSSVQKEIYPVTLHEIKSLLELQENDPKNGLRNILVTQLICYLALSRESIINIKDTDVIAHYKKNRKKISSKDIRNQDFEEIEMYSLKINNKFVKMPVSMTKTFTKYIKQRKDNRIKFNNFFYSQYTMDNEKFKVMSVSTINQIINDSFNKVKTIPKERRKYLNYSLLRTSVIKLLYDKFSLEELSQITYLNIDTLYKNLTNSESLKSKINKVYTKLYTDHPLNNEIF